MAFSALTSILQLRRSPNKNTLILFFISLWIVSNFKTVHCEELLSSEHYVHGERPRFLTRGETIRAVIGDTVVLPCQAEHLGPYAILWKRGNSVLTAREMKIILEPRITLVNGFNLQIRKVRPQDGGDYICQVSTQDTMEQIHTLEILVPPSVRSEAHNGQVVINKGDSVNLQCRGSGNPVPTIRWTRKNNLNLPNGEQFVEGNSYNIQKADRHQGGTYICTASNGVGTPAVATIEVKIHYPPEVFVDRGWVHSGEGFEAELACSVHADPPATVRWYRDTMLLDTTDRRLVEERGSRHSLIIRKVQTSDFGNYSCEADNKLGRVKKHMELSGKPNRAVFRSDPNGRMRDTFNISWIVESFASVTEHRLLYRKAHYNDTHDIPGEWNNVVLPGSDALYYPHQGNLLTSMPRTSPSAAASSATIIHEKAYFITNLEPEAEYEAQAVTRNRYGWAQPSELFSFHTRRTDRYPYESSPQHDVLSDQEMRGLGMTAASSLAISIRPSLPLFSTTNIFTSILVTFSYLVSFRLVLSCSNYVCLH